MRPVSPPLFELGFSERMFGPEASVRSVFCRVCRVHHVATHCLLEAVVALVARTRGLKAILLEDRGDEGARVCNY